nr:hypothetical protein [Streptomyces sp. HPF1205]
MTLSRWIVAALPSVLGSDSYGVQPSTTISADTVNSARSRWMSAQPWPTASPRRRPRKAMRWKRAYSRWPSAASRKRPSCFGVQTMTADGFWPVFSHCRTRSSVHSRPLGRFPEANSTCSAGLKVMSCREMAAFSAARSVERIR